MIGRSDDPVTHVRKAPIRIEHNNKIPCEQDTSFTNYFSQKIEVGILLATVTRVQSVRMLSSFELKMHVTY